MRILVRRLLGASALCLLFGLPLAGCSGQQQDEEGMEVSGQENQAAENQAAENEEGSDNQAAADQAGGEENQAADEDGGTAEANNAAENDLQEIIQEMNGQQGAEPAAANTAAAPVQPAPAEAAAPAPAPAAAAPAAPASSGPTIPFQPGGSPAGPGLPEPGSKMAYVVEQGDTLAKISQKIYGSNARWKELATLSGIPNPSRIYPGDLVYYVLDESALAFAAAYESVQKAEETVQAGDTLATIAQRVYGTTTGWRSIWRHNDKIDNPDIVPPGSTVVYIPKGAATAALKGIRNTVAQVGSGKASAHKAKGGKLGNKQVKPAISVENAGISTTDAGNWHGSVQIRTMVNAHGVQPFLI